MRRGWRIAISAACFIFLIVMLLPVLDVASILSVRVSSPKELSLVIGDVADNGGVVINRSRRILHGVVDMVLPNDVNIDQMAIGFDNGPCEVVVQSIVYRKWGVVPYEIAPLDLIESYRSEGKVCSGMDANGRIQVTLSDVSGVFIPLRAFPGRLKFFDVGLMAFVGGLVFLWGILFSIMWWLKLDSDDCPLRVFELQAFFVALVFSVVLCLTVPLQSFFPNQSSFDFPIDELVVELLCCMGVVGLSVFCALNILRLGFGRFATLLIWLFALMVYLNAGPLSFGCAELDGNLMEYHNPTRAFWDGIGLVVLFVVVCVSYRWSRHYLTWMSLSLLILVGSSMFDLRVDGRETDDAVSVRSMPVSQILDAAVWSAKKNTLVLILDALTTEIAEDVFSQDPVLHNSFSGFTFYKNNVGMHVCTELAVPALVTGLYRSDFPTLGSYGRTILSDKSFISSFIGDDVPTFISVGGFMRTSWTNQGISSNSNSNVESSRMIRPLYRRMKDQQAWNLLEISRFRIMPFALKYYVYGLTFRGWPTQQMGGENMYYSKLKAAPVSPEIAETFHFYHTEGAHAPYLIDRYGRATCEVSNTYAAEMEKGWYALGQVSELFADLKSRNVYDSTFILVVADHGGAIPKTGMLNCGGHSIESSRPHPLLLVKTRGAHGLPVGCDELTSHSRIADLVRAAHTRALSDQDAREMLKVKQAVYQVVTKDNRYLDFVFHDDDVVTCHIHKDAQEE